MNSVILIGRIVNNVALRYLDDNRCVANFTLAVNRVYSKNEKSDFFKISVWGKQAKNCDRYLEKGKLAAVKGKIHIDKYKNKDGEDRYSTTILADSVQFLQYKEKSENYEDGENMEIQVDPVDFEDLKNALDGFDDLPF